jgi:ornithine decarboxylase
MGISFHVGSGSKCATAVADAIAEARQHFGHFKGGPAPILDIGGGFLPDATDFQAKAAHIRKAIATLPKGIELWAEPGRFFAANSFDFFVKVIGKKPGSRTILEGDSSRQIQDGWKYTLDDSIYGQFSNILFDKARPSWIRVPCMGSSGDTRAVRNYIKGTLFGRTCDSLDMIAKSDHMEELEIGDWLWFPRMGAYTQATASEFNGFPMPDTCVVEMEDIALGEFPWNTPKGVRYQTGLSS